MELPNMRIFSKDENVYKTIAGIGALCGYSITDNTEESHLIVVDLSNPINLKEARSKIDKRSHDETLLVGRPPVIFVASPGEFKAALNRVEGEINFKPPVATNLEEDLKQMIQWIDHYIPRIHKFEVSPATLGELRKQITVVGMGVVK